jgi:hypothetical protein
MKFVPYIKYANDKVNIFKFKFILKNSSLKEYYHNNCYRGIGFFALRDIFDGEELFVDYFYSKLYDKDKNIPDWLVRPPPMAPYFTKYKYETKFSFIA